MNREQFRELVRHRLAGERGRLEKQAPFTIALAYPSPYRVGMSSLGYLQIYKEIQAADGMACERVFLPDDAGSQLLDMVPVTYESFRPITEVPVIALSVAYELELAGLVQLLDGASIPPLRRDRDARHPIIVAGGPLTFSNPLPLAAFADVVVMGEADGLAVDVFRRLRDTWGADPMSPAAREHALRELATMPHVFVPEHHLAADNSLVDHEVLPPVAQCDDSLLPAWSPIRTPDTELSDMFLLEAERGCSRGCTYCVMRRSTNGGMRLVSKERLLELIPEDAAKVGLVGAAVSDHPEIIEVVNALADRGSSVGLSSLRPNRLTDPFVAALKRVGYKTLTTAMDGASDRVRAILDRRARVDHLRTAAELTRKHKLARLKLYLMLGVPGETDGDVDECVEFVAELSRIIPVALTIAPFCAKRNTPLDGQPFAGIKLVERRIDRLRRGLRGRADVRATSARWAWVEYVLAQGGIPEAYALYDAVMAGGRFHHYKKAFAAREDKTSRKRLFVVRDSPREGRRTERWLEPAS
jgi:radical SAM superfamily enzyme YgiQ (UPF0313 family)